MELPSKDPIDISVDQSTELMIFWGHFRHILLIVGLSIFLLSGCEDEKTDALLDPISSVTSKTGPTSITDSIPVSGSITQLSDKQQRIINLESLAKNLTIVYQVVDNLKAKGCESLVEGGQCFDAEIVLSLQPKMTLDPWRIYFSHMSPILQDDSAEFNIHRVNGDLHYIEPTDKFTGWQGNTAFTIPFKAQFWHISEFDSPPNFYLVGSEQQSHLIHSTLAQLDPATGQEILPHVAPFKQQKQFKRNISDRSQWATADQLFSVNQQVAYGLLDITTRIIPKPYKVTMSEQQQPLDISNGIRLEVNEFNIGDKNPAIQRMKRLGISLNKINAVPITISKVAGIDHPEAYQLSISKDAINIRASSEAGAFYALQSINALLMPSTLSLPTAMILPIMEIEDQPRYDYRGLFIDVARNFRSKQFIIKMLDQMAAYKLNKFHFHLGDDEGWRLEIPGLPELTQLGSQRCHDLEETTCLMPQLGHGPDKNNPNNGYYTLDDYRSILLAAKARNIQVIPSFDMPGHSRAAVKSMQLRYKKFMALGKKELAEEYLLTDLNDQSQYSSVQFYNDNTLNVCLKSTYRFVEKVLDEVIKLHNVTTAPLTTYHIGADETPGAWRDSPKCRQLNELQSIATKDLSQYFILKVSHFLAKRNITTGGWSDGFSKLTAEQLPKNIHVNAWTPLFWDGHKIAHSMANRDWKVVLSLPDVSYFDFPYQADPKERGYYWGSRFINTRKLFEWMPDNLPLHAEIWNDRLNRPMTLDDRAETDPENGEAYRPMKSTATFYGIQAQLWSEMIRSDEIAEYMLFPRLLALAERAWYKPDWEPEYDHSGKLYSRQTSYFGPQDRIKRNKDWAEFANAVAQKELTKLEIDDVFYRIPTAGAQLENGWLKMNSIFPSLPMEYQTEDGVWTPYSADEPIVVKKRQSVRIRVTNQSGNRAGRSLLLE